MTNVLDINYYTPRLGMETLWSFTLAAEEMEILQHMKYMWSPFSSF